MSLWSRPGVRALAGIVSSALLFGLYSRGGNAYLLGFVALAPWLLVLDAQTRATRALMLGWAMSLAFVAAVFAWFGVAVGAYTGIGSGVGLALLLVGAPLMQPQILVFALVRHLAGRRHGPVVRALAGASAWVATEWLAPKLLQDTLGHGLFPSLPLRQAADLGGAAGLTFLLILVNEALAHALSRRRDGLRAMRPALLSMLAIPVALAVYGFTRVDALQAATGSTLRVGMVQTNLYDYERMRREMGAYEAVRHVLDTHYTLSREAVVTGQVDALLWSETVYPTTFAHPKSEAGAEFDREILDFATVAGVPLVFGTYDIDGAGEYNAAAFVEPKTGLLGFYRKTHPFPLTESVPAWLDGPTFRRWFPWTGTWRAGDGARVLPLRLADGREIPVQPLICLDDVHPQLAIDGARMGAQAILGMSNDSWFTAHPVGADLHLTVAAFRSIETRLPQLRVTANGVSAVIDAAGTLRQTTGMGERALLVGEVNVGAPTPTLMVKWGDWVGRAALAWLTLLTLFAWMRRGGARVAAADRAAAQTVGDAPLDASVVLLAPAWRWVVCLLRGAALVALAVLAHGTLTGDASLQNPLAQIRLFAALVLAPWGAAWAILRAGAARIRIEGGALRIDQRERRVEIPVDGIAAVEPWRWPVPGPGVSLRLLSGARWSQGIALPDPDALREALVRAGARFAPETAPVARVTRYARALRASPPHRVLDHPLLKFVLFPLVPALPAFRLHQHIAYGGTFGEYQTFGLKAYVVALLLWWGSWAVSMAMVAAGLCAGVEAATWGALWLRPAQAIDVRRVARLLAHLAYYVGVPVWLVIRLLG